MSNKKFIERLNKELDNLGMPEPAIERAHALAKMLKIPRFKADALLNGLVDPKEPLIDLLAAELEVSAGWLLGQP